MSDLFYYKKHPIYTQYAADHNGNIKSYNLESINYCEILNYHKFKCFNYCGRTEIGIIINFFDRCKIIYPLNQFIWECFNGLIPYYCIIKSKNRKEIGELSNLYSSHYKICKCELNIKIIDIRGNRIG